MPWSQLIAAAKLSDLFKMFPLSHYFYVGEEVFSSSLIRINLFISFSAIAYPGTYILIFFLVPETLLRPPLSTQEYAHGFLILKYKTKDFCFQACLIFSPQASIANFKESFTFSGHKFTTTTFLNPLLCGFFFIELNLQWKCSETF